MALKDFINEMYYVLGNSTYTKFGDVITLPSGLRYTKYIDGDTLRFCFDNDTYIYRGSTGDNNIILYKKSERKFTKKEKETINKLTTLDVEFFHPHCATNNNYLQKSEFERRTE